MNGIKLKVGKGVQEHANHDRRTAITRSSLIIMISKLELSNKNTDAVIESAMEERKVMSFPE